MKNSTFKFGLFTNNVYDVLGFVIFNRLIGIIIKSKFIYIYSKYQLVNISYYHLPTDSYPQFTRKRFYLF